MANISSAFGTLTIDRYIWNEIGGLFEKYIENYRAPYYGVNNWYEPDIGENVVTIQFSGTGRWAFDSCINDVNWFFNVEDNYLGYAIIGYFINNYGDGLSYEYSDEEAGCGVLYTAEGNACVKGKELCFTFNETSYEYTSRNLVKLGFYDEYYDDFDEVVTEIKELLKRDLTEEEFEYVKGEFYDSRYDGVFLEGDLDDVTSAIQYGLI